MNLNASACEKAKEICCNLDVWGILVTVILQDAPFFVFRLIIIIHYRLVNSMNLFCTAKNTLVITLQVKIFCKSCTLTWFPLDLPPGGRSSGGGRDS